MDHENVPQTTINRLPIYLRCLLKAQAMRMPVINSLGIAEMAGTNAAQVRKDLSYLGELGTRGIGYDVDALIAHISRWLGLTADRRVGDRRLRTAGQRAARLRRVRRAWLLRRGGVRFGPGEDRHEADAAPRSSTSPTRSVSCRSCS